MTVLAQPLGTIGSYASGSSESVVKAGRLRRWKLQDAAAELLPGESVAKCCRHTIPNTDGIPVVYSEKRKSAHYRHLLTCGSVWTCPICSAKISEERRIELMGAVERSTFTKLLVTFTFQHSREDRLVDLREELNAAYRRLKSGRFWQDFSKEFGLVASVAATELTWGEENGWHIHKHVLFFTPKPADEFDLDGFKAHLVDRYTGILASAGRYASDLYGIDVQIGDYKAAKYASKWGLEHEITKANIKVGRGGYSPFQLLELYQAGKLWAGALYQEYAAAMKGYRQLVWSRGGRAVLGLGVECSDEELAAAEEEDPVVVLAVLSWQQFRQVCRRKKRGEVLEVATGGDPDRLWDFLETECGLTRPLEVLFRGS